MGKKTPGGAGTHTGHTSARTRTHGSHSHRRTGTGTEVKWHAHKHNDAWMSAIEGTVKGAPFGVADRAGPLQYTVVRFVACACAGPGALESRRIYRTGRQERVLKDRNEIIRGYSTPSSATVLTCQNMRADDACRVHDLAVHGLLLCVSGVCSVSRLPRSVF